MANKMTNVEALTLAIATLTEAGFNSEAIEKLNNIKTSYEKKSTSAHKPTATQLENERIKTTILDTMESGVQYTVTDITKIIEGDFSNQKISALLNGMAKNNLVNKVTDKRKSYFVKA